MNIIDKVENIDLNKLSQQQKASLLKKIVLEFKKGKTFYLNKIFEIIDSLPFNYMKSNTLYQIESLLEGKQKETFIKNSILKYTNKQDKIEILTSNNISYQNYKLDILKIFCLL